MPIDAAKHFMAKAKEYTNACDAATHDFYVRYIQGDPKAQQRSWDADVKQLTSLIADMEKVAKFWHADLLMAIQSFGGPSDTKIHNAKTLLNTMKHKIEEAKKAHT